MKQFCWFPVVVVCVGTALSTTSLFAANLDEAKVKDALQQRFDENRNGKLEAVEARQARLRLKNLMEDTSGREINISTWRDDAQELLKSLDQDADGRLSSSEKDAGSALLDRLIPQVDMSAPKKEPEKAPVTKRETSKTSVNDQRRSSYNSGNYTSRGSYQRSYGSMGGGWGTADLSGYRQAETVQIGTLNGGKGGGGSGTSMSGGSSGSQGGSGMGAGQGGIAAGMNGGSGASGMGGFGNGMSGMGMGGFGMGTSGMGGMAGGNSQGRPGMGDPGMMMTGSGMQMGANGFGAGTSGSGNVASTGQLATSGMNSQQAQSSGSGQQPLTDHPATAPGAPSTGAPMGPTGGAVPSGMPSDGLAGSAGSAGTTAGSGAASGGPAFTPPPPKPNF